MRQRHELLASTPRLEPSWGLDEAARTIAESIAAVECHRLVAGLGGFCFRAGRARGKKTGPSPVDRRKNGSKHHVLTDGNGTPMVALLTAANRHDITQLLPLIDAIPKVSGKPGRPRWRFEVVQGDRAYHSEPHRKALRQRGSRPLLARRNRPHGSGLGKTRWPVERTLSWLHQNRRLRVRYEKRPDIHAAFMTVGEAMICWNRLHSHFC